jgi:hypothetical protein
VAAQNNRADMVRYLLEEHHVDIHVENGRFIAGPTALGTAIILKALECIAVLLQHSGPLNHIDDEINNIDDPIDTVLAIHRDVTIRFITEMNAEAFIDNARHDWSFPDSRYVRVELTTDDRPCIEKLQIRRKDEGLRKERDERELNLVEGVGPEWVNVPEFPTIQERVDELQKDKNLIPLFKPAFVAA